jgi:hypothetical protein
METNRKNEKMKRPDLKPKLLELLLQEADLYKVGPKVFEEFVKFGHTTVIVWLLYSWQKTHRASNATNTLLLYQLLDKQLKHSAIKDAWYRKNKVLMKRQALYEKYSYEHIFNALYKIAPSRPLIESLLFMAYPTMRQIAAKLLLKEGLKPRDVAVRTELSYNQVYRIKNTQL